MILISLIPLFAALFVCVAAGVFVMKRKSLAQSTCIQQAALVQQELIRPLNQLLALNPSATRLRAARVEADTNLAEALATMDPPVIAAAKAQQEAVILQQAALHAKQLALLYEAQKIREAGRSDMRQKLLYFGSEPGQTPPFYPLPLAVEPKPQGSPSPNYETVANFTYSQQERFRFSIDVMGHFPKPLEIMKARHPTECSVSLEGKEPEWKIRVLAASPSLRP